MVFIINVVQGPIIGSCVVLCLTSVLSKKFQLVLALFITNTEGVVFSVSCLVFEVFQVYPKPALFFCQSVNLF